MGFRRLDPRHDLHVRPAFYDDVHVLHEGSPVDEPNVEPPRRGEGGANNPPHAANLTERCSPELSERLEIEVGTALYRGEGCDKCRSTGYQGRLAVFELMKLTEGLKALIHRKESASTIRR